MRRRLCTCGAAREAHRAAASTRTFACRPDARAAQQRAASPVTAPARSAAHAHAVPASAAQVARARKRRAARAAAGTCSRSRRPVRGAASQHVIQRAADTNEHGDARDAILTLHNTGGTLRRAAQRAWPPAKLHALFTAKCFHRAASRAAATALAPARAADCQRPSCQRARRATRGRRRGGRRTRNALDTWRNLDTHTTRFPP